MEIDLCILCITFSTLLYSVLLNAFQGAALSEMTAVYHIECFSFCFPPPLTCWSFAVKIKSYCFSFLVPPWKMSIGFGPKCPGSSFIPCTAGLASVLTRGPLGFCSFTSSLLCSKCQSWGRGKEMLRNECAVWNQRQLPDTPTLTNDISFCTLRK